MNLPVFSGAVLTGGASSRMGTDKAFIEVDGRPLVTISADALRQAGASEVFVVGGDAERLEALGLPCIPDRHPGEGPLGGLITALAHAAEDVVAVLACDHLATEGPAVRSVVGALGSADAAVPITDGRMQTLHGAWRRSTLSHLEELFAAGARSIRDGLRELEIVRLLDGDPCWFADADTPADLPIDTRP